MRRGLLFLLVLVAAVVEAHEGDAEERAMRMHGLLLQLDRTWAAVQGEADTAKRSALLETHGRTLLAVQESVRDAADKSPCVMMESQDKARQLACLVDTEARLRATERVLEHVINRQSVAGR